MQYLGVDYGTKRIGLARSDTLGLLAFPLSVIPSDAHAADAILAECAKEGITMAILGRSIGRDGKPNPVAEQAELLATSLRAGGLTVAFIPEHYSSQEADRAQGKDHLRDARAAAIILQSYLDGHPGEGRVQGEEDEQ